MRPPLRAFRHALEHRGTALFAVDAAGTDPIAFELSTELEATGRVIASAAVAEPDEQAVRSAARELLAVIAELADGCLLYTSDAADE